jgi:hypothetical protein
MTALPGWRLTRETGPACGRGAGRRAVSFAAGTRPAPARQPAMGLRKRGGPRAVRPLSRRRGGVAPMARRFSRTLPQHEIP